MRVCTGQPTEIAAVADGLTSHEKVIGVPPGIPCWAKRDGGRPTPRRRRRQRKSFSFAAPLMGQDRMNRLSYASFVEPRGTPDDADEQHEDSRTLPCGCSGGCRCCRSRHRPRQLIAASHDCCVRPLRAIERNRDECRRAVPVDRQTASLTTATCNAANAPGFGPHRGRNDHRRR